MVVYKLLLVKTRAMTDALPKLVINDGAPLRTAELRDHATFMAADPHGELPDVQLGTGVANPMDRPHNPNRSTRVGINDADGKLVGNFNLIQTPNQTWINDIRIEQDRQGEKLGVATYVGVLAAAHSVGRTVRSDIGGLSEDSNRVWESLVRRRVAQPVAGEQDQHGFPRYVSRTPNTTS